MATNFNYRLIVKDENGYRKFGGYDCHETKSLAGRLFHHDNVKSVCVVDTTGFCYLYLVKDEPQKNVNVSSKLSKLIFA